MDFIQYIKNLHGAWSVKDITVFSILSLLLLFYCYILFFADLIELSQMYAIILSFLYLGYVFGVTVFTRTRLDAPQYNTTLFWSWNYIIEHRDLDLFITNLLNCLMLLPSGVLLPFIVKRHVFPVISVCFGIIVSLGIELSQLVGWLGLFEWDDVVHNALGCMIGGIIGNKVYKSIQKLLIRLKNA